MSFRKGFDKRAAEKKKKMGAGEGVGSVVGYMGGTLHGIPKMFDHKATAAMQKDILKGHGFASNALRGSGRNLLRVAPGVVAGTLIGKYSGRGVDKLMRKKNEK